MIELAFRSARGLAASAHVVVPCWVVGVLLDQAVGIGWITGLNPGRLTHTAASPAFVAASGAHALVRAGPLLLAASVLAGRGLPEVRRFLGVSWSEFVLRGLPTVALLAWAGFFDGTTTFGRLDIGALAALWLAGGAVSDFLTLSRPVRWGTYAEAEPALFVLARVADEHPFAQKVSSPAGVLMMVCGAAAAGSRLVVAFDAIGVTGPPLPSWCWWAALAIAGLLDLLVASISVDAWRDARAGNVAARPR
jgi:hypothetical protein